MEHEIVIVTYLIFKELKSRHSIWMQWYICVPLHSAMQYGGHLKFHDNLKFRDNRKCNLMQLQNFRFILNAPLIQVNKSLN